MGLSLARSFLIPAALLMSACSDGGLVADLINSTVDETTVNAGLSSITVSGDMIADGRSTTHVDLVLRNIKGNPVPGVTMTLDVSGSGNVVIPCTPSDASGASRCGFVSSTAGAKNVRAWIKISSLRMAVTIAAPPPSPALINIASFGDVQNVGGGHVIVSAGTIETEYGLKDSNGVVRVRAGHLPTILGAD